MNKLLFIGLGNPGAKYQPTRHNAGVTVVRHWVETVNQDIEALTWQEENSIAHTRLTLTLAAGEPIVVHCIFPLTFMNNSGRAVVAYMQQESLPRAQAVIVHDDIELPLGTVKLTPAGSAKGHNGVKSIHEILGTTEIARLRLGVGRPPEGYPVDQYVLENFTAEEIPIVQKMVTEACEILTNITRK